MKNLIVDWIYFTFFIPLMMLPIIGWGMLIVLGEARERISHEK